MKKLEGFCPPKRNPTKEKQSSFADYQPNLISFPQCSSCGSDLPWGIFAYKQETCWPCFRRKVVEISKKCETPEESEIIIHMLASMAEIHHVKL